MSQVLSDPTSHKVGHAQQHSITKQKWYVHNWALGEPEGKVNAHGLYFCYIASHFQLAHMALRGVPYDWLTEEKTQAQFTDGSA